MIVRLDELQLGQRALITQVQSQDPELTRRLLELGVIEHSEIQVIKEAPFGRDPILVRVRGALIGLRRNEASAVQVEILK